MLAEESHYLGYAIFFDTFTENERTKLSIPVAIF
jgi:hypothetical protein